MKIFKMNITLKHTLCLILISAVLISTFTIAKLTDVSHAAGLVLGEATTLSSKGAINNSCGIPAIDDAVFELGVIRDPDTYVELTDGENRIKSKFSKRMIMNESNSLYIVTQDLFSKMTSRFGGKFTVSWYNYGSKTLQIEAKQEQIDRIKVIENMSTAPSYFGTGVYYNAITTNATAANIKEKLGNGKWKTLVNTDKTKDMGVISWIFKRVSTNPITWDIENRIETYLHSQGLGLNNVKNWTETQLWDHRVRMLDLLMVCYNLMPSSASRRSDWEQAIEDWISGDNLTERPVTLLVTTAVVVNPGSPTNETTGHILTRTTDFINYATGVEGSYLLYLDNYNSVTPAPSPAGTNPTYSNIAGSINQSIKASPNFQRITDTRNVNDGYYFGLSAMAKYRISTSNGYVDWRTKLTAASYLDILQFTMPDGSTRSGMMFILTVPPQIPVVSPTPTPTAAPTPKPTHIQYQPIADGLLVEATPDNKTIETATIGDVIKLNINSDFKDGLSLWQPTINEAKRTGTNIDISLEILRSPRGGSYTPNYIKPQKLIMSPDQFISFLQGSTSVVMTDNVSSVSTTGLSYGDILRFHYEVEMTIDIIGKTYRAYGSDTASFVYMPKPSPTPNIERRTYTSTPSTWSEIKQGSPYNESFEAMAGVPTTETLYFASGGSEFIVDLEVQLMENQETNRTYRSYFTAVDSEFKVGDTAGDYNVPTPTGSTGYDTAFNAHQGGTVWAEWEYTVTNNGQYTETEAYSQGSAGSTCAGNGYNEGNPGNYSWTDKWDAKTYNDAVTNAKAWQTSVNNYVVKHTSASDKIQRQWNSWGATLAGNTWGDSITESQWPSYTKVMGSKGVGSGYSEGCGHNCTTEWDSAPSKENPSGTRHTHTHSCGSFTSATETTITKTGDKSFKIRVEASIPAHVVCGPSCCHTLPQVQDTWTQKINYDYLRINKARIWKIDQSSVNGLKEITGTDEVKATVMQGDPNIFFNISSTNTSKDGRLRYSIEPQQHDTVVWNEGPRSNKDNGMGNNGVSSGSGHASTWATGILYTNGSYSNVENYHVSNSDAKDKNTIEYAKFDERRKTLNTATVISDLLILQTSSGDQSVIYFDKDSIATATQNNFPAVEATIEEMWDNNPNSASSWGADQINIGSYNGRYSSPTTKYEGTGNKSIVHTKFDSAPGELDPASVATPYGSATTYITRPARPSKLLIYKSGIAQIEKNVNKVYVTGKAETFWRLMTTYLTPGYTGYTGTPYSMEAKAKYGLPGHVVESNYSPTHSKVNDIVVHNPVSVQGATVVGLPTDRDQRSTMPEGSAQDLFGDINGSQVCPRDPGLCDFRVLNCTYFDDVLLADFDFENGVINKVNGSSYSLPTGFSIENTNRFGTGKSLSAKGTRWSIPLADLGIAYNKLTKLYIEANIEIPPSTSSRMITSFQMYDLYLPSGYNLIWNTGNGVEKQLNRNIIGTKVKLGMEYSFNSLEESKLYIDGVLQTSYTRYNPSSELTASIIGNYINIGSWGSNGNYPADFYIDNLKIIKRGGTPYHTDACYQPMTFHPDGNNVHVHSAACLTAGSSPVEGTDYLKTLLVDPTNNTNMQTAKQLVGPNLAYLVDNYISQYENEILAAQYGVTNLLGTITFPAGDTRGFASLSNSTITSSNNKLYFTATGADPQCKLPVNIKAGGLSRIKIYYNNLSSGTVGQVYYKSSGNYIDTNSVIYTMVAQTSNQVATVDLFNKTGWTGDISELRFDFTNSASGVVEVTKIEIYGLGIYSYPAGGAQTWVFGYTGGSQTFNVPSNGTYTLELWGAQGNSGESGESGTGGKGAYVKGDITLTSGASLTIMVGGKNGFNGGGLGGQGANNGYNGGGATDIRMGGTALANRIVVAGGGGGGGASSNRGSSSRYSVKGPDGGAGGLPAFSGGKYLNTMAGSGGNGATSYGIGVGGARGECKYSDSNDYYYYQAGGGGGGGGYYGGGGGGSGAISGYGRNQHGYAGANGSIGFGGNGAEAYYKSSRTAYYSYPGGGGGGGSSYLGSLINTTALSGNDIMPNPAGGTMLGKEGDGHVKISSTVIGVLNISFGGESEAIVGSDNKTEYELRGYAQTFTAPLPGRYILEVWGAEGGGGGASSISGGAGGYSKGELVLSKGEQLFIYVGGKPLNGGIGGWNGGGSTENTNGWGGGGATDIRKGGTSLNNRIIVAGGGGGSQASSGGHGGGLTGLDGGQLYGTPGYGATQTAGGGGGSSGSFGQGGIGRHGGDGLPGGGGGGGWYGGGGAISDASNRDDSGGGGGSGYIGGVLNGTTIDGSKAMPRTTGTGTEIGHAGNGYARVSWSVQQNSVEPPAPQVPDLTILINNIEATVISNYTLVPDKLTNGDVNPIWGCKLEPKTIHVCNEHCYSQKVLVCTEPHHMASNNSYDSKDEGIWSISKWNESQFGWDDNKQAWKAKGQVYIYLKPENKIPIDTSKSYIIEVTAMVENDIGATFYWGGDRLNSAGQHLAGYGGTYDYSAASSARIPEGKWVTFRYEGKTGTTAGHQGWGPDGCTHFRVGGLLNYTDHTGTQITYVKDIKFYYKEGNELMPRPVVDINNVQHYDGSNDICWDACGIDANHKHYKPTVTDTSGTTVEAGTFINMDWPFQVYFPNRGDFNQGQLSGIPYITTARGKGFVDNMDTTKWTKSKRVKFDFNVIYEGNGQLYRAGEWIELPVNGDYYNFYCVLANYEAKSAGIEYEVEAINCPGTNDNKMSETNKQRYTNFTARHGAYKRSYVDIVGRIGNLIIDDTDDFRFCNLFKTPLDSSEWIAEGVVKKVNSNLQNMFMAWNRDIRGNVINGASNWLNTYGTQSWAEKSPILLPLSPEKNNIASLKEQPMRPGYDILAEVSTIGNYGKRMQIVPYYYALNLSDSSLKPVDVYMVSNNSYKPINIFNIWDTEWEMSDLYPYIMNLDWANESNRRNYDPLEKAHTDVIAALKAEFVLTPVDGGEFEVTGTRELDRPVGNYYPLGTSQLLELTGRARTFIGGTETNGVSKNIGNRIPDVEWWEAAQRWHFKVGLPSSAVFVEHNSKISAEEIKKISNDEHVIVLAVDIKAIGDTYVLGYNHQGTNGTIQVSGVTYAMPSNIPPVLAVYSANKSSIQDVDVRNSW